MFCSLVVGAVSNCNTLCITLTSLPSPLLFTHFTHTHVQAEEAVLRAKLPEEVQRQYPPGVEGLTGEEGQEGTAASKQ